MGLRRTEAIVEGARTMILVLLLAPGLVIASDADIRIFAGRDDTAWVGEEVPVHLELWTRDLSFFGQSFVLPEVPGALLVQTDTGGVNLSERRGGETWQGLRYSFSLYPQRAGTLVIPTFAVRFSTRAGFNQPPASHAFETSELEVTARRPPGVEPGSLLVTSGDFSLDASWSPEPGEDGDAVKLQTGDALVLTVRREAADVPGMVFAPLPSIEIQGLGVYPDAPEVNDRVYRGELVGARLDRVTVVAELAGSYVLPKLSFEWWDPRSETLQHRSIPELRVEVTSNPNWGAPPAADGTGDRRGFRWNWLGWLAVPLLLWWPLGPLLSQALRWFSQALEPRRLRPLNPVPSESNDK